MQFYTVRNLSLTAANFAMLAFIAAGCTPPKFEAAPELQGKPEGPARTTPTPAPTPVATPSPTPSPTPTPSPSPTPSPTPSATVSETFQQDDTANKVDILIIDDNSASMETKQEKMADRFKDFISGIKDLDYQIGITTTDLSGPSGSGFATDGRLVTYTGSTIKILNPMTPNADSLFLNTIRRNETINCDQRTRFPYCPSSNEEALGAIVSAIDQRAAANAGFFRDGADLAVVVLTDEDEMSDGTSSLATRPSSVIQAFKNAFGSSKRMMVHGIIIQPGDSKCYNSEYASSGSATYGTFADALVQATGGRTYSICDADYGKNLSSISKDVRQLVSTFELVSEPDPKTVQVTLTPKASIKWRVQKKSLIFDSPPPAGTKIDVTYVPK